MAKLERAVRAALWLRRHIKDVARITPHMTVPKEAVARFDAVMEELKAK